MKMSKRFSRHLRIILSLFFFTYPLAFGISRYGSLNAEVPLLPRNMSVCEFDVVAMDPLYATSVHLKLVCK